METLSPCCAGLDVHKKTVVACVRRVAPDGQVTKQVQSFDTFTDALLALADRLATQGATRVALEATGVSWKPVWSILEAHGGFELMLVNAQHLKQVPGRKTDVKDAEGIAELLLHGLLRPSFVPPKPIRQLRDLTRQRAQLIAPGARVLNRIQKVLEDANIKPAGVATDVLGASGRAMIAALIAGEDDPAALAGRAKGSLRGKRGAVPDPARLGRGASPVPAADADGPGPGAGGDARALPGADRGAPAPVRGAVAAVDGDPGGGPPGGRSDRGGDRRGHDAVRDGSAPELLGGDVPGQ